MAYTAPRSATKPWHLGEAPASATKPWRTLGEYLAGSGPGGYNIPTGPLVFPTAAPRSVPVPLGKRIPPGILPTFAKPAPKPVLITPSIVLAPSTPVLTTGIVPMVPGASVPVSSIAPSGGGGGSPIVGTLPPSTLSPTTLWIGAGVLLLLLLR